MKQNQFKKINKFICCLVILSLFLQFVPSSQSAQAAESIVQRAGNWLKKLVTKVALPDITLDEKGNLNVGSFNLLDKLGPDSNPNVNPFSQFKLSMDGKEVKSQVALVEPKLENGCIEEVLKNSCGGKTGVALAKCIVDAKALTIADGGCSNPKAGELTIPDPYIPEICELSIPLPGDNKCDGFDSKCESKILAKNKACIALNRLQQAASQEVYSAYKIFNATDPFTECLFVRNCRTNCSLRVGELAFTVSLLDVAALFIPGGFLNVVQKILDIAKMINEAFKIYTAIKEFLNSGVEFLSDLFNVMGQLSSMFSSFSNLGLRWSDVLIYGGGALASNYLGDKVGDYKVGPDVNGNIGWQDKVKNAALGGGEWALTAGDGLLGGVAASAVLNTGRVKQAVNGMQDMLANFAQNNLKFSAAKTAAITANEKLKKNVDEIRTSFKNEEEFSFFFKTGGTQDTAETSIKKQNLDNILGDFQLFFRSVDEFLNDVKQASSLKDGRPVSDLTLGGGLDEWKNRAKLNDEWELKVVCDQGIVELPLGGGLPATGDPNKYNCYVPDMVKPINGKIDGVSCSWLDLFKTYSANTVNLKEFFRLTDPDTIKKAIVGCDNLSRLDPTNPNGEGSFDDCDLECYKNINKDDCVINAGQKSWREYWESLGSALYGQKEWKRLWDTQICIPDPVNCSKPMEEVHSRTVKAVNEALFSYNMYSNALTDIQGDQGDSKNPGINGDKWKIDEDAKARKAVNRQVGYFFDDIRRNTESKGRYFLERAFPLIEETATNLTSCTDINNLPESGSDSRFWNDDYFYSNGWPYLYNCINTRDATCVEEEVRNSYEGEAAYEAWDEKVKIIVANQPNFKNVKEALELGVSPEKPIVVYKIAKANNILESIKTDASKIGNDTSWNDIANKIIDSIIYGTPKDGSPVGTVCSDKDCPASGCVNLNLESHVDLIDNCAGGIYQTQVFPNKPAYFNYVNCCKSTGNSTANPCCNYSYPSFGKLNCDVGVSKSGEDYTYWANRCENALPVVKKYKCSGANCIRDDASGTYLTSNCNGDCTPNIVKKYKCSGASCIRDDANGTYTTVNCNNDCVVTPPDSGNFKCRDISDNLGSGNTWCKCVESPFESNLACSIRMLGDNPQRKNCYSTEQNCIDIVGTPNPNPKFKCSGSPSYICNQDSAGTYNSLANCRNACKKPNPNPGSTFCRYLIDLNPLTPWCNCQENPRDTDAQCVFVRGCYGTESVCKDHELAGTPISVCGNGDVEQGEECDDGNTRNGDGCSSRCRNEGNGSVCGNGVIESGEQCDDGNTRSNDGCSFPGCQNEGGNGGPKACGNAPGTTQWCLCPASLVSNGIATNACIEIYPDPCVYRNKAECEGNIGFLNNVFAKVKSAIQKAFKVPQVFAALDINCENKAFYDSLQKCYSTNDAKYKDGFKAFNDGTQMVIDFEASRGSLSKAIASSSEALQNAGLNLSKAFEKLQKDWNATPDPFVSENQESATARAQIDKILELKTNSEDIVNNKIPEVVAQIGVVKANIKTLKDFIGKVPAGDSVDKLNAIINKFDSDDPNNLGAIQTIQEVIDFAYAKIGPKDIGDSYQCDSGKCLNSVAASTFLCRIKCFERDNGRSFNQLTTYVEILGHIENAAYGLIQAGENIKAIEPSMDMKPVTVKPNLVNEMDERWQCCLPTCHVSDDSSSNSCLYTSYSVVNEETGETKKNADTSCKDNKWTTQKCKEKTSLFVGQREGESNYQFFKDNLLANPLSTLEEKFSAVNVAVNNYLMESVKSAFGDTAKNEGLFFDSGDLSSKAKDNNKGEKEDKKYKELSDAVLKQGRYMWWDLIWGNDAVSKEIMPACTITEQILTNNPLDIENQCKDRLTRQEGGVFVNTNLLPPLLGGTNTVSGYNALKDQCKVLTSIDLDILDNLKSNPTTYFVSRYAEIERMRHQISATIRCPEWFCLSPTSSTWGGAGMNKVDPYCKEVTDLYCQSVPNPSKGAILCDVDTNAPLDKKAGHRSITPSVVWSVNENIIDPKTPVNDGAKQWPPNGASNHIAIKDMCIQTQGEILELNKLEALYNSIGGTPKKLDALTDECNTLSYQEDFASDCRNFDVLKGVWNNTLIGNYSSDPNFDTDVENTKEAIKGFCRAKTGGKVITETIQTGTSIGTFFDCPLVLGDDVRVDLTGLSCEDNNCTIESQNAREVALKLCSQSTTDLRTPLNEIMKVFSVLLGVKSYTTASNGIGALYFDAQKIRQQAESVKKMIEEAPKKFAELWNSNDVINKIGKDNVKIKPVKCIAGPMISYAGDGKALTGENGGQVCPNVGEQFSQLDASFSQVRQNLRMIDMARIQPITAIGFGNIGIDIPDIDKIDPDLNEVVGPIYNRASEIKNKAQLLWALATAINYANENCTCGQSYCPMLGKIPLCVSGLPLTLTPLKQPFCHLIWTLRYPLGSLAEKLKQELETQ
ncbi:MAG: myxococcus cysteine-rich repeat containing protein [bacterium]|nr:myxococcus cysteine-rich repeat containing protein [bacterium]